MRLPDFVICGAPRSGTTWLYHVLDLHPDVWMAKPARPEPKFFLVDSVFERGLDFYAQNWFGEVGRQHRSAGEKSSNYLESPVAAARIAAALPETRLIFILREPADRARSNYRWSKMNGLEPLSFASALAMESERERAYSQEHRYSRPFSYFSRGLYARHLVPYLALFSREQRLILRFEDLVVRPGAVAEQVHEFLGVRPRPEDGVAVPSINASAGDADLDDVVRDLRLHYRQPNRELAEMLGSEFEPWS